MAKLEIRLPKGKAFHQIDFSLPSTAMHVLNHGGTVDISRVIIPLLKAAFEAGVIEGFGWDKPTGVDYRIELAGRLAAAKYGGDDA